MPPAPSKPSYWALARAPRYSLTFALPLLLLYEALAFLLSGDALAGVRNGADVLLKSLFTALGGRHGLTVFGVLLLGGGAALVWRDRRAGGPLRARVFGGMLVEAVVYAALLGTVASGLTSILLGSFRLQVPATPMEHLGFTTQIMISLGAGIYEELLFRVVLVSGLAWLARTGLGWKPLASGIAAAVLGALVFSTFHYVGPYGDPFQLSSFTFRGVAGLLFSGLYLTRGLGITAWSHALYDVMLAMLR